MSPVPAGKDIIKQDAAKATGSDKEILDKVLGSPLVYPTPEIAAQVHRYRVLTPDEEQQWNDLFVSDLSELTPPKRKGKRRGQAAAPFLLQAPANLWQIAFFVVPMFAMLVLSLESGNSIEGFTFTWHFQNYTDALTNYTPQYINTFRNAFLVTVDRVSWSPTRSRTGSRSTGAAARARSSSWSSCRSSSRS